MCGAAAPRRMTRGQREARASLHRERGRAQVAHKGTTQGRQEATQAPAHAARQEAGGAFRRCQSSSLWRHSPGLTSPHWPEKGFGEISLGSRVKKEKENKEETSHPAKTRKTEIDRRRWCSSSPGGQLLNRPVMALLRALACMHLQSRCSVSLRGGPDAGWPVCLWQFDFLTTQMLAPTKSAAMGPGGTFGYAEVNMQGHPACIQIGTHGSLTKAELEEIASGGPHAWTPGACPARYARLDYGVHILSAP